MRFEVAGELAVVGVAVAPEHRGDRWGAALVAAGCRRLAAARGSVTIEAEVRPDNEASRRTFLAADFVDDGVGPDGFLQYVRRVDRGADA